MGILRYHKSCTLISQQQLFAKKSVSIPSLFIQVRVLHLLTREKYDGRGGSRRLEITKEGTSPLKPHLIYEARLWRLEFSLATRPCPAHDSILPRVCALSLCKSHLFLQGMFSLQSVMTKGKSPSFPR